MSGVRSTSPDAPRVRASLSGHHVTLPKKDLDALLAYQRFRGRRAERDAIAAWLRRLAKSNDTAFVGWAMRLHALARRVERRRCQ